MQSEPLSERDRFDSWKEIAGYLNRSVRTVRRWEELEALPVHRLQHEKRGSVYAYRLELDAWRASRRVLVVTEPPEPVTDQATDELNSPAAVWATEKSARRPRESWLIAVAAAVLIVAALALALRVGGWNGILRRPPEIDSLAVLPLQNLSRDPDQEYFADGMTDELITDLAKAGALRVISRTSIMRYKGLRKPLAEIARELNVDAVVEGTVQRVGERVRITAQLIQVKPEKHLWAETYERDLRDVLVLQESVAHDISVQIRIKLTPQEQAGLLKARPIDPEAHEAYLKGIYFWNKRTAPSLEKSIGYFNQALAKDPKYALAYVGLADAYNSMASYAHIAPREAFPKSHAAALKALALDDTLAEAHASIGYYKKMYEWDEPGADREFRRAIELGPGYAFAHVWRGEALAILQRYTEAVAELDRACALDPTSLLISDQRGFVLYMARRYDDAIEQIRKTIALEPRFAHAHCWLGKAYLQKGMLPEGLAELQEAAALPGGDTQLFAPWVGYAYALAGKRTEAYKVVETTTARAADEPYLAFGIAAIYSGLRQKDQALAWLEKTCQERHPMFPDIIEEPAFDFLRSDAHFRDLVRRSALPP